MICRTIRPSEKDGSGMAHHTDFPQDAAEPRTAPLRPVRQNIRVNILRAAMLVVLPLTVIVDPAFSHLTLFHEVIESVGVLMLIAGVLGRFWATLYIGGVKNREVVQGGPYSTTRNPLYVASAVAATGIGLMVGSVCIAALVGGTVTAILYITAQKERAFLEQEFGDDYRDYAARVPFFWPDVRLFRTESERMFRPAILRNNLRDAFVFLAFIPLVELLDLLKDNVDLTLLTLP
jgi:protein-S-isoprenylcysteine O-methyltransferase Ste14